jgi:hypothetical protein
MSSRITLTTIALLGVTAVSVSAANAAPPKAAKPAKKPVVAAAANKPSGPIVLGTTQLPGDFGALGQTYTIGKSTPINFTLNKVEYSVAPISIGTNSWVPKKDQKVMVLHYTLHNPVPREQRYYWGDMSFTAVDANDVNHNYIQCVAREGSHEPLSVSLKPAQKLDVYAAILVPADGMVPKLMVERERGAPVIRYDLRGKAAPLTEPFADPADATGATARKEVPAKAGEFYPLGELSARLDSTAFTTEPLGRRELKKDHRYLTAVFTVKNISNSEKRVYWGDFATELIDADGEKVPYTQSLLKATRDEQASGNLQPGEEMRVRFFFPLPQNVNGKTMKLAFGGSIDQRKARTFAFDVSDAK